MESTGTQAQGWRGREGGEKSSRLGGVHGSRFTIRSSRFTVHDSQFTVYDSQFTIHSSRFVVQGSRFTVHGSRFAEFNLKPVAHSYPLKSILTRIEMCNIDIGFLYT